MRRGITAVGSAAFFLVGPGIMGGLVPWLLTGWRMREPIPYWVPMRVVGAVLLIAALIVLVQAFVRFVLEGFGTPAPMAAPTRLVVGGPYRYVRWYEEPALARRFGADYQAYRLAVPAWWPRLSPWKPSDHDEPNAK